jgi:hypothetical protein
MPEAGDLRALGITAVEEAAYELLLVHPRVPVDQLTSLWAGEEDLERALAGLVVRGLAEPVPGDPPRYLALAPGAALGGRLTDLERELLSARDRVTELTVAYHRRRAAPCPDTVIEVVTASPAMSRRIAQIAAGAREEIRSLDRSCVADAADVAHRAICDGGADITELTRPGQQVRVLPSVPMRLDLVDSELGVLPPDGDGTLIVVHPSALLTALSELFESLWSRALPLPSAHAGQPATDQRLISLLLAGLTDTASARHLGVSQRTVQRRVAALLDELGVATRFQAGAKLALRETR